MLVLYAWMNVAVQGNIYAGVSENFTERFYVKAHLYASGGKSVAKSVEVCVLNSAFLENVLETIFHCSRLNKVVLIAA